MKPTEKIHHPTILLNDGEGHNCVLIAEQDLLPGLHGAAGPDCYLALSDILEAGLAAQLAGRVSAEAVPGMARAYAREIEAEIKRCFTPEMQEAVSIAAEEAIERGEQDAHAMAGIYQRLLARVKGLRGSALERAGASDCITPYIFWGCASEDDAAGVLAFLLREEATVELREQGFRVVFPTRDLVIERDGAIGTFDAVMEIWRASVCPTSLLT